MTTFQPLTPNWLSASWDQFVADDPELQDAYGYDDYPSVLGGEGNWVDLYLTLSDEHPVGRLWISPESSDIGLLELPNSNTDHATRIALTLRELNHHGVSVFRAYDYAKSMYFAGEEQTGDLSVAANTAGARA
jgi:hypothetical protein